MHEEIDDVRELIKAFVASEKSEPFLYVLARFNDRGDSGVCDIELEGKPAKAYSSRNRTELSELVSAVDALPATGGGDCHEYGFAGILKAMHTQYEIEVPPEFGGGSFSLNALEKHSHIIVVTDAPSKDSPHCITSAIDEAKEKDITVYFFLSNRGCIRSHGPATINYGPATNYLNIAEQTNGIVIESSIDFSALAQFVQKLVEQKELSAVSAPTRGKRSALLSENSRCHSFQVSAFDRQLDILFKTHEAEVITTKPDRSKITTSKSGATLNFFSDPSPIPGTWTSCVRAGGSLSISTVKPADVKFVGAFLEEGVDEDGTKNLASEVPYACTKQTLVARVLDGGLEHISTTRPVILSLLDADKNVVREVTMSHCSGLLKGEDTMPESVHYIGLRGEDTRGIPFSYTRPTISGPLQFRTSDFRLTASTNRVEMAADETEMVTLQLQTIETDGDTTFNFKIDAPHGFSTSASPFAVMVSPTKSASALLRVSASHSVLSGSYTLTITAHSGCSELMVELAVVVEETEEGTDVCGGCQNGGTCHSFFWGGRLVSRCGCTPGFSGVYCQLAY